MGWDRRDKPIERGVGKGLRYGSLYLGRSPVDFWDCLSLSISSEATDITVPNRPVSSYEVPCRVVRFMLEIPVLRGMDEVQKRREGIRLVSRHSPLR